MSTDSQGKRRSRSMLNPSGIGFFLYLKRALLPKKGLSKNEHHFFLSSSEKKFSKVNKTDRKILQVE